MAKIYLVDTMFHIFRSYYALPPMNAPDGTPTNAVHGVINMASRLWRDHQPDALVFATESIVGVFRETLDPDYKAQRKKPDEALVRQIPLVCEAMRCLGLPVLTQADYEADDVIATIAKKAAADGHQVTIVSNDKDMAQILQWPGIRQLKLSGSGKNAKEEWIDAATVVTSFGVHPHQIADWLALVGDTVDNIPGLKGIGPKTAAKLLSEHGTLDALLEADLPKWPFKEQAERLRLNKVLSQAVFDLPIDCCWEELRPRKFAGFDTFLQRMGMRKHLAPFEGLIVPESIDELWGRSA